MKEFNWFIRAAKVFSVLAAAAFIIAIWSGGKSFKAEHIFVTNYINTPKEWGPDGYGFRHLSKAEPDRTDVWETNGSFGTVTQWVNYRNGHLPETNLLGSDTYDINNDITVTTNAPLWRHGPPQESFMYVSNPSPEKAFQSGQYGTVKDNPMFISYRDWDGEIRIGGVAKQLSAQSNLGGIGKYYAIEIDEPHNGNGEHLLFSKFATNIIIGTNYTGTIQVGTNFYRMSYFK